MSRLVVVSNRVPVPTAGKQAGGLAVALDGLMERRGGLWFGWGGGIEADAGSRGATISHHAGVDYATVPLTREEHDRYYNGFSNGVLWPLLHTMPELIAFDRRDAEAYRDVNQRLAGILAPMLQPSDLVWVHDYHLLPLASALRAQGVRNPIGFFLHIPFPAADVLHAAPDMPELVREMLAADLIGFQTDNDLANFSAAAEQFSSAVRVHGVLQLGARRIRLGVFPVEIDARSFARMAREHDADTETQGLLRSLHGQRLIMGAERLDPTKGLTQRIAGYRRLLETRPEWQRHVTMLQIAATSRKEVDAYRSLRAALDQAAGALNNDLGQADWTPLRLVSQGVDRALVAAYMRHAQVGLVTPLRDGMNLVAKEYVAAQDPDDPGVLVLSRFAGAAQQLDAALMVNPRDSEAIAEAIHTALTMSLAERKQRWQALWSAIEDRTPLAWGKAFLTSLLRAPSLSDLPQMGRIVPLPARVPVSALPPRIVADQAAGRTLN